MESRLLDLRGAYPRMILGSSRVWASHGSRRCTKNEPFFEGRNLRYTYMKRLSWPHGHARAMRCDILPF